MEIKTSELTGSALDWAVGTAIEAAVSVVDRVVYLPDSSGQPVREFEPSTNWCQGGVLVDRRCSALNKNDDGSWWAHSGDHLGEGSAPLIAAMRAIVAAKLGDEIEVPDELLA